MSALSVFKSIFPFCFPLKANHLAFSFTSVCWILGVGEDFRKRHVSKDLNEKILSMLGKPCIPGSERHCKCHLKAELGMRGCAQVRWPDQ